MEKRGQVYLIAAIIIIGILFSIIPITNYIITKKEPVKVYDLSKELDLEGESVINYGVYNQEDTLPLLENFSEKYSDFVDPETELLFIYGNKNKLEAISYNEVKMGNLELIVGGAKPSIQPEEKGKRKYYDLPLIEEGGLIKAMILNYTYDFKLQEGENFFFIVKSKGYVAKTKVGGE